LLRRAVGDKAAVVKYQQSREPASGQSHVVDSHYGEPLASGPGSDYLHERDLMRRIETRGRFVGNRQRRVLGKGACDQYARAFTARELQHVAVGEMRDVHLPHRFADQVLVVSG